MDKAGTDRTTGGVHAATGGPVALATVTPDLAIGNVNDTLCDLLDRDRDELLQHELPEYFADPRRVTEVLHDAARRGQCDDHALAVYRADDSALPVSLYAIAAPEPTGEGRPRVVAAIEVHRQSPDGRGEPGSGTAACDRPHQGRAGAGSGTGGAGAARIDSSPVAQLTLDLAGTITDVNHPVQVLLGEARGGLVGTPLGTRFTEPARVDAGIRLALNHGEAADFDLVAPRPDGTSAVVSYRLWPVADAQGRPAGLLAALYDLSEWRHRERPESVALDELEMAQAEFIATISHELRSPLTGVLGYLELLQDEDPGPLNSKQRHMLQLVEQSSRQLLSLVENLLAISGPEADEGPVRPEPVDFSHLVERACQAVVGEAERRRLVLVVEIGDGLGIEGNTRQLDRVLTNLLSNAVNFTMANGRVEVCAHRHGKDDQVVLVVKDSGIGIPVEEQPMLFSKFFRSSLARRRQIKGTGLGLYIVRQIVAAHHGTVEIVSEPGEGTTVVVRLPVRQPGQPPQHRDRAGPGGAGVLRPAVRGD